MQNGARYQAVLELITEIFKDEKPADALLNEYLRARKYIGSKDRRFISDLVWKIIRNRLKLEFSAATKEPRKILLYLLRDKLDEVFDGSAYGLSPLTEEEKKWLQSLRDEVYPDFVEAECPQWLFEKIKDMSLCKALNEPAGADFRVNGISREEGIRRLRAEGFDVVPTTYSPYGIRSLSRISLGNCIAYQEGVLEVQDEASQIASILCDVALEHKIMDYCCGAGGKSLMLAHLLGGRGHILAHDISAKRLEAIKPRMQRLNLHNIELTDIIASSDCDFDRLIMDVPCSGTGTWRRAPDAKFRLKEETLKKLVRTQRELLEIGAQKVKVGGRLIYITCSLLPDEDEENIDSFLRQHSEFSLFDMKKLWAKFFAQPYPYFTEKYLKMSPLTTGTDGFFVAVLQKNN